MPGHRAPHVAVRLHGAPSSTLDLFDRTFVLLVGPAGCGKTHVARSVAHALGLQFESLSVGPETSKADLMGFVSPITSSYVESAFFRAYTQGGVFLIDEIDAGNEAVLLQLNMALDSPVASFGSKMYDRHPDFRVIAGANTHGNGADMRYVGRNRLDAATTNRFITLTMDYDHDLERELAGNDAWTAIVQEFRAACAECKLTHVISPRQSIQGARLIAVGFSTQDAAAATLTRGMKADEIAKVRAVLAPKTIKGVGL